MKFLYSLLLVLGLCLFACEEDPCEGNNCGGNGTCVNGTCVCENGYSGEDCQNFDPCATTRCFNGGGCDGQGGCLCPEGFIGDQCQTSISDFYRGTYAVTQTCDSSGVKNYQISISESSVKTDLLVSNIDNSGDFYTAEVINQNFLIMRESVLNSQANMQYGSLNIEDDTLSMFFVKEWSNGSIEPCPCELTKL